MTNATAFLYGFSAYGKHSLPDNAFCLALADHVLSHCLGPAVQAHVNPVWTRRPDGPGRVFDQFLATGAYEDVRYKDHVPELRAGTYTPLTGLHLQRDLDGFLRGVAGTAAHVLLVLLVHASYKVLPRGSGFAHDFICQDESGQLFTLLELVGWIGQHPCAPAKLTIIGDICLKKSLPGTLPLPAWRAKTSHAQQLLPPRPEFQWQVVNMCPLGRTTVGHMARRFWDQVRVSKQRSLAAILVQTNAGVDADDDVYEGERMTVFDQTLAPVPALLFDVELPCYRGPLPPEYLADTAMDICG